MTNKGFSFISFNLLLCIFNFSLIFVLYKMSKTWLKLFMDFLRTHKFMQARLTLKINKL